MRRECGTEQWHTVAVEALRCATDESLLRQSSRLGDEWHAIIKKWRPRIVDVVGHHWPMNERFPGWEGDGLHSLASFLRDNAINSYSANDLEGNTRPADPVKEQLAEALENLEVIANTDEFLNGEQLAAKLTDFWDTYGEKALAAYRKEQEQ